MSTPPPIKPPPPKPAAGPKVPAAPAAPKAPARATASFSIEPWSGDGEGEKVVIYADSGMGKTTLASMAPSPVFIGLDDGARKIRDPRTNAVLNAVKGIRDYQDVRDVFRSTGLFKPGMTAVLDTITKAEEWSEPFIFANYKKDNATVKTLEGYGFGKGYRHSLEVMRLLLQDMECLVRQGVNVVLLAQSAPVKIANAEGLDFIQDGPKLHHNNQYSNRLEVCEWADHVLRIGYTENVVAGNMDTGKGKMVSTDTTRVVYTRAARHYFAKSRTLQEPVISFSEPKDDSLWQFLFPNQETK
jgi:hypothetical protein